MQALRNLLNKNLYVNLIYELRQCIEIRDFLNSIK